MNKQTSCCFTGHRQICDEKVPRIIERLDRLIPELAGQGYAAFLAGGALGFDTLAAQAVLRARGQNPGIRLIIIQPCRNHEARWNGRQILLYRQILEQADEVVCLSDHYYSGCMQVRNRYLIDNSGLCAAYLTDNHGGTGYTVKYAKARGIPVINLRE